jgi:hypothetical protein
MRLFRDDVQVHRSVPSHERAQLGSLVWSQALCELSYEAKEDRNNCLTLLLATRREMNMGDAPIQRARHALHKAVSLKGINKLRHIRSANANLSCDLGE